MAAMNTYRTLIARHTGVSDAAALAEIERIMRDSVLHTSLDYCTRDQLIRGALIAAQVLRGQRRGGKAI